MSLFSPMTEWCAAHAAVELAQLEDALADALAGAPVPLRHFALEASTGGGKRLRPLLLFLSAAGDGLAAERAVVRAAVAVELVHTASIVHDDIIDDTDTRRGRPALHAVAGARAATLAASYLLFVASRIVQTLELADARTHARIRNAFGRAATEACAGQLREVIHLGDLDLDAEDYCSIAEGKTGRLFEVACEVGGLLSGGAPEQRAVFGRAFGALYQLVDDVRDLFEGVDELRRAPFADLSSGVLTLPLILALRTGDRHADVIRAVLRRPPHDRSPADMAAVRAAVRDGAGREQLLAYADDLASTATRVLDGMPGESTRAMQRTTAAMEAYLEGLLERRATPMACHAH